MTDSRDDSHKALRTLACARDSKKNRLRRVLCKLKMSEAFVDMAKSVHRMSKCSVAFA